MILADFLSLRGAFKHRFLQNECFERLGGELECVEKSDSIALRATKLVEASLGHIAEEANFRRAAAVWLQGNREFSSAAKEIMSLWTKAAHLEHYQIGPQFPKEEHIRAWLDACDAEMREIDEILEHEAEARLRLRRFWEHALLICDWLASLSNDHPMFWKMLQRPPFSEAGQ